MTQLLLPHDNDNVALQTVPPYVELVSTSNFSFLRGASHPEELAIASAALGLKGFGLTDRNSFAGVVRAYVALRDMETPPSDFRYLVGTRLCFSDGTPDIVAYPTDREAYGRLCKLISIGNLRGEKGAPSLKLSDLAPALSQETIVDLKAEDFSLGQLLILMPDENDWARTETVLRSLARHAVGRVWIGGACRFQGNDRARLNRFDALGRKHGAPLIAVNDVLYHEHGRRVLQDVVTCIREHRTIADAGRWLEPNAERHIKTPDEMVRLFREHPDAIDETVRFASRIGFSLDQLKYNYPTEAHKNGETPQETLERLTWDGALERYHNAIPDEIKRTIWSELCLIAYKGYASYFLTVHDIVHYARHKRGILCQGRGSAANSAVCFCLGVTEVNPHGGHLVFGRFLSTERDEPPDIDVDFEHERREEVMQYVYAKYGGNHTGLTSNVICYRSKAALREVA